MRKNIIVLVTVLMVSVLLIIIFSLWGYTSFKNENYGYYNQDYGNRMMGRWFNSNNNQVEGGKKLTVDQIKTIINNYIEDYGNNLEVSDIFVYKDTDYYVSVEENDTGRGAMELLVNPYTGQVYPDYGPNMTWNEKYAVQGGYGMMRNGGWNMMGGTYRNSFNNYNDNTNSSKKIDKDQAVKVADEFVKDNIGKEFFVLGNGHEFYGYYTLHINKGDSITGMLSVNYYTGDIWYHNWHGELEQVISKNE